MVLRFLRIRQRKSPATGYVHVYRAARIILLQTLFALTIKVTFHSDLSNKFKEMELSKAQAEYNIQDMVNDISLSVSEVLENLEEESWNKRKSQDDKATAGYVCLWPLNIAFSVKTLGDEQRGDISRQLNFIESRFGLRQALRIKER